MRSLGWLVLASLSMATATCSSSDPAPAAAGGSSGASGSESDAAVDATEASTDCDPKPEYDSGLDDAATTPKDATVIIVADSGGDLEGGLPPPIGRWSCYVDLGEPEPYNNCTGHGMTCCELKDECYHPETEQEFCLRPYCK